MTPLAWLAVPGAYLLGGFSAGYWLVRWQTGADVRAQGSGATGATNTARVLGRRGFVTVLVLDAAKGAVSGWLGRGVGLEHGWEFAAGLAVVAGHVWPVQLGFRGGRGLAPLLGAWLVLAPWAIAGCLVAAAAAWAIGRRKIVAGLLGALLLPAATAWETGSAIAAALTALVFGIVASTHRSRIDPKRTPDDAA